MRITLRQLRDLISEVISASPQYMQKERVREQLQAAIVAAVQAGKVKDPATLAAFLKRLSRPASPDKDLALTALKSIPFEVWLKLAKM
jgi:hypothetical protein